MLYSIFCSVVLFEYVLVYMKTETNSASATSIPQESTCCLALSVSLQLACR